MLVVRSDNVATVSLSHIYEIDFKNTLGLYFRLFDVTGRITAPYLNVLLLIIRYPYIIAAILIEVGSDKVPEK